VDTAPSSPASRIARHLLASHQQVRRAFPDATRLAIQQAISASEAHHAGEICFAVEPALQLGPVLRSQSARERAIELFSERQLWDTEHRNGVLVYLLMADREVEIVADRGIHQAVGTPAWQAIRTAMEAAFRLGQFEAGVLGGIAAVTALLSRHFPLHGERRNELSDAPVLL